jgi:surface protein
MLYNNTNLTYINLNYVKDPKGILAKSDINRSGLTVCQKENIINKSTDNRCCYYNITSQECENQNYITIFFGDRTIYNTGFGNDFRGDIDFIINGEDHNKKLSGKDRIYLHRGSKLEIYYLSDSLSLQNYFSAAEDANMKNLISVYLSNLNATVSNNLDNMFYGCESLKTVIDLNDIKTLQIVNMSYMFYNCTSIEYLDLSAFNTSSVQNMISVFEKASGRPPCDAFASSPRQL